MKLTLLGTGVPAPSSKRAGSGHVVQIAGDTFVFDHGPGSPRPHAAGRHPGHGRDAVVPDALPLRPLHGRRVAGVAALGPGRRQDPGPSRVRSRPVRRIFALLFGEGGVFAGDSDARTQNESSVRPVSRPRRHRRASPSAPSGHGTAAGFDGGRRRLDGSRRRDAAHPASVDLPCLPPRLRRGIAGVQRRHGPCDALVELPRGGHPDPHVPLRERDGVQRGDELGTAGHRHAAEHAQRAGVARWC